MLPDAATELNTMTMHDPWKETINNGRNGINSEIALFLACFLVRFTINAHNRCWTIYGTSIRQSISPVLEVIDNSFHQCYTINTNCVMV